MNKKSGFALVFAIIIMSLIMAVMASFFAITTSDLALANTTANGIRAYYLAEAGIARKFVDLRSGNTSSLSTQTVTLSAGNTGTYEVVVTPLEGGSYRLDSTGTYNNKTKIISLTVRSITCAKYVDLTNNEGDPTSQTGRFTRNDVLRGPLHVNGRIYIALDPVFEGPVSSVRSSIYYYHGGPPQDNPDFREGLTLGAPAIALPSSSDLITPLKTAAQQADGLYLTGSTIITLLSNGTMNVTNAAKGWTNKNVPLPQNKALYVGGDGSIQISGILLGQLTVGAERYISVTNNILYSNNPRTNPASTDILALVSQKKNVYVEASAPYNLEIDAYIVAPSNTGSFTAQSYDAGLKGTLTLYGGITQGVIKPIGTFNYDTGQRLSGYQMYYDHDTRLESTSPAYFPPLKDSADRLMYVKTQWAEL